MLFRSLVLKEISTCCKCNSYGRNLLALLNYNKYFVFLKIYFNSILLLKFIINSLFLKFTRDNFYERKTLLTTNAYTLVQVEHYLYFYKKRGLKLLRMFIKLLFGKFKIRPRLHRFYKNARIRAKLRTNIRRFKKYRPLIIEFIELIRRFINHDAIKVVLDEQSVQDLKEKLKCKLTKSTKNYVLFSWLKT